MSARKYVPNRLRGVLGGEDGEASANNRTAPSRAKGKKSRPWRVDAASWKQQLQERKAVYDHFALPEKADEDHKEEVPPQIKSSISMPPKIDTSITMDRHSDTVETVVTPRRGEQVETVLTVTPGRSMPADNKSEPSRKYLGREKSNSSLSSQSSSSSKHGGRKASPLPRNRRPTSVSPRKGKKSSAAVMEPSPHRTRYIDDFSPIDLRTSRSSGSYSDGVEYDLNIDTSDHLVSKDSNIGIIDGVPSDKNMIDRSNIFTPKSRVRLLRHGDSDDTAESIGLTSSQDGADDANVDKSTMMQAMEAFIHPSSITVKPKHSSPRKIPVGNSRFVAAAEEKVISRIRHDAYAKTNFSTSDIDYIYRDEKVGKNIPRASSQRRAGRRRPRHNSGEIPLLSAAESNLSTSGTINGNFSHKDQSFRSSRRTVGTDEDDNISNDTLSNHNGESVSDDDWSIRPIPSDEEVCLEKRRWPVRKDAADSATLSSGDTDIMSIMNDGIFVPGSKRKNSQPPKEKEFDVQTPSSDNVDDGKAAEDDDLDDSESSLENIKLRQQIAMSLYEDDNNDTGHSSEIVRTPDRGNDTSSAETTGATPDPLQRARKTLLVSNLNRSVRSQQDSAHSRGWDDESVENSSSRSMFVPLRSRGSITRSLDLKDAQKKDDKNDIPLNVLNDHGVYVSRYNKNGIFVPPMSDSSAKSHSLASQKDPIEDQYNEHGAYVPQDSSPSRRGDRVQNDYDTTVMVNNEELEEKDTDIISLTPSSEASRPDTETENKEITDATGENQEEDVGTEEVSPVIALQQSGVSNSVSGESQNSVSTIVSDSDDKAIMTRVVGPPLVEDAQELESSESKNDSRPEVEQLDTVHSSAYSAPAGSDEKLEEMKEMKNNDTGEEYDPIDDLDAMKLQVISDLKERIDLVYTGNHAIVESIGTSEDSDPLDALRRKRESKRVVEPRESMALKIQLNHTVSSLNTDHHHVIESPGTLKSVKGKKWKSRVALKKAAKKSNGGSSKNDVKGELEKMPVLFDNESPPDEQKINANEFGQHLNPSDMSRPDTPTSEKSDDDHEDEIVEKEEPTHPSPDATQAEKLDLADDIDKVENEKDQPEKLTIMQDILTHQIMEDNRCDAPDAKLDEVLIEEGIVDVNTQSCIAETKREEVAPEDLKGAYMISVETITKAPGIIDADGVGGYPNAVNEPQEELNELPPTPENNNIIQGLPPNKGKKWKDRLKKKKDRKSDQSGSVKKGIGDAEQISPTNSLDVATPQAQDSNGRPAFNRAISDLTTPPEEKTRTMSPTTEIQVEPPPKNAPKKTNKWKNRLAKMKGSKQEPSKKMVGNASDVYETSASSNSTDIPAQETVDRTSRSFELDESDIVKTSSSETPVDKNDHDISGKLKNQLSELSDVAKEDNSQTPSGISPSKAESNKQDLDIQRGLQQSFNAFDAFLNGGHAGTNPVDDESIYTELTIGQESIPQHGIHENQMEYEEEELSYMDFTMEESVLPPFVDQTIVSKIAPKDQMMSPFMSNLLSSRLFQDAAPTIPMKSLPKEHVESEAQQENVDEKTVEAPKKFPTITVGSDYDDDMTQITMGSLEDDDENEDDIGEKFFDAKSKPFSPSPTATISPAGRSAGKKSRFSTNSRRSESASSYTSQPSCSESSKQRIAEILRKEVWSHDPCVVRTSLAELEIEARKGYNFRAHIVRCGGVMTIMRAMEMNSSSDGIIKTCCSMLEKLAMDPQTQVAICEMEGISLIVRSMQDHSNDVQLQETACIALATVCRQREDDTSQDPMKGAKGAVPTLLSCMTRYPTNSTIQAKAFGAIASLCTGYHSSERLEELSKAGGIMTLTMALQTPWENKNDQHEAISNLSILLRGIAELNDATLPFPNEDEALKDAKLDGTSRTSNETESDDAKLREGKDAGAGKYNDEFKGKTSAIDDDVKSQDSYVEDIPEIPIMSTSTLHQIEDIPDLGELPTMMSDLEWNNYDPNDPDSVNMTSAKAMSPDRSVGSSKHENDEQCTIQ